MTPVASVGNRTSEVCGEVLERLDAASELRVRVGGSGAELLSPRPPDDPGHLPVKQCVELWALGRVSDPRLATYGKYPLNFSFNSLRARCNRDSTVPRGTPSTSAISSYANPSNSRNELDMKA